MELPGQGDRVLTGEGVGHEQGLGGSDGVAHGGRLGHQFRVLVKAPGGVQDHHVEAFTAARLHGPPGDRQRLFAEDRGDGRDVGLAAKNGQLLLRRRPEYVERGEQDLLLVAILQPQAQLGARGGLARPLQADHENGHRRLARKIDGGAFATQHFHQMIMDDLDHQLARGDAAQHLLAHGALADGGDEVLDHGQRHVGLEQRHAHLAQGFRDVGFAEGPTFPEALEDLTQPVGQVVKHCARSSGVSSGQ